MDVQAAMLFEGERQARHCEALNGNAGEREWELPDRTALGTTPGLGDRGVVSEIASEKLLFEHRKIAFTSSGSSVCGRRDRPIRKNIIGRSMSVFQERFAGNSIFLHLLRAFLLFHQPACQHGRGVLLRPKVQKRANLLAQVGGMAKPRKFIALQRVSRSRKQKLPRGLRFVMVHAGLLVAGAGTLALRHLQSMVPMG